MKLTSLCSRDKEFTIKGTENCLARGFDRTGFCGGDRAYAAVRIVQLTESNEQPAQRVPGIPGTVGPGGPGGLPGTPGGAPPGASGRRPAPGTKKADAFDASSSLPPSVLPLPTVR